MPDPLRKPDSRGVHRSRGWISVVVFIGAAYFYGGASWNQNARLDAVFTAVEPGPHQGTFRLDPFLPDPEQGINTGDWTRVEDHYYANKAPGTLLLGALVYLPLYRLECALGADLTSPVIQHANAYLINLGVTVLPLAVAMACWATLFARRTGPVAATALALGTFFGTALFPYATQLWGHTTAAAFAMLAVWAFDRARATRRAGFCTAAGLFGGIAVLSDFLAAPVAAAIAIAIWLTERGWLWRLIAGGAGPAVCLFTYQWYSFGGPWHLPTDGTNPMFVDHARALGLFGWPSGVALFQMTVGPYRGLFVQMPLLLAAIIGFRRWWRRAPEDPTLWICLGSSVATLLWVSTFNGWHGGASVSPRYLIVVLPLVALALREVSDTARERWTLAALAVPSVATMLAIAAVSPLVGEFVLNPLFGEIWPQFLTGHLHPHVLPIRLQDLDADVGWRAAAAWNWGDLVGLSGLLRVTPWVALAGSGSFLACRLAASRQPASSISAERDRSAAG